MGDIRKVKTTGASSVTARADNQSSSGVAASEAMAEHDSGPMGKYKKIINKVAREKDIHPALIAAIISRESRAGEAIKNSRPRPGLGDHGKAFGLMQVDEGNSGQKPVGKWDSEEHLLQATQILVDLILVIQKKFPNWSKEEQLKGGIAAYNMGDQNVTSKTVDRYTTNHDYANDVVARAQWFIKNGYDLPLADPLPGLVCIGAVLLLPCLALPLLSIARLPVLDEVTLLRLLLPL